MPTQETTLKRNATITIPTMATWLGITETDVRHRLADLKLKGVSAPHVPGGELFTEQEYTAVRKWTPAPVVQSQGTHWADTWITLEEAGKLMGGMEAGKVYYLGGLGKVIVQGADMVPESRWREARVLRSSVDAYNAQEAAQRAPGAPEEMPPSPALAEPERPFLSPRRLADALARGFHEVIGG